MAIVCPPIIPPQPEIVIPTRIVPRSEIAQPGDAIVLCMEFRGPNGELTNLDEVPSIDIVEPNGRVRTSQSKGIYQQGTGKYAFNFEVGIAPDLGVWTDIWKGIINGFEVFGSGNFVVATSQMPALNTDGYKHLGDDPGFDYSQNAICNINSLIQMLRARLRSSGKRPTHDEYGNTIFENCDIFTVEEMVTFLCTSLEHFNAEPTFTFFSFEDTPIVQNFGSVLVQGATVFALGAQALVEKGRELNITDNGISFTPPQVSDLLNTQYSTEMTQWIEMVQRVKRNMKPNPLGLGTFRPLSAAPQVLRLRWLRARRIF